MKELNKTQLSSVNGGHWDWSDISGSLGYNVGAGAGWFYNNVMIGNPWSNVQLP